MDKIEEYVFSPLDIARFWMNVEEDKESQIRWSHSQCLGHCWSWKGSLLSSGYGRFFVNCKSYRAHRVAFYLFNGKISNDMFICHKCDNPKCVNPKHLFSGAPKDNTTDRDTKGRYKPAGKHKGSLSQYSGVHFDKHARGKKKWMALYTLNYKHIRLGRFETELEAAHAYDKSIRELNKTLTDNKKRNLNFPD